MITDRQTNGQTNKIVYSTSSVEGVEYKRNSQAAEKSNLEKRVADSGIAFYSDCHSEVDGTGEANLKIKFINFC